MVVLILIKSIYLTEATFTCFIIIDHISLTLIYHTRLTSSWTSHDNDWYRRCIYNEKFTLSTPCFDFSKRFSGISVFVFIFFHYVRFRIPSTIQTLENKLYLTESSNFVDVLKIYFHTYLRKTSSIVVAVVPKLVNPS